MKKYIFIIMTKCRTRNLSFLMIYLFLFTAPAIAQNNAVETHIQEAFNDLKSRYIQEKIYVHTDKSFYLSGEILWFRMYYFDEIYNKPLTLSKIAYVEILDKFNKPVLQEKISLKPGEANGSFIIPFNIPSGVYKFRAYTNWMKNFGEDYFFEKPIRIVNPQLLVADSVAVKTNKYDVQFFPEGGDLIQNVESKVAFRITDANGKGLACNGELQNSNKEIILKFSPGQMGIGHFSFTPLTGQTYQAVILLTNGEQVIKDIPVAHASGYVMNLS